MKKIYLIVLFPFLCFSQDFNAGIIGGISTTQVSGDGLSGFNKLGPRIGLYVNRQINWFQIQLELQYLTKGSKKLSQVIDQEALLDNLSFVFMNNYNFHLDYIGVPILFSSNITEKIKLELGSSINILINQKEEIDFYIDNSRKVNKLENSFLIGVIYNLSEKYALNIRLSHSIFPIRKHSSGQVHKLNRGQYNTGLSFSVLRKI